MIVFLEKVTAVTLVKDLRDKGLPLRMSTYKIIKDAFGPDALALVGSTAPPPEAFLY